MTGPFPRAGRESGRQLAAGDAAAATAGRQLSDVDLRMLAMERRWWRRAGAKDEAIRVEFGMSRIRYYQVLNRLIGARAALAVDPVTVARLRRGRDAVRHRRWSQ